MREYLNYPLKTMRQNLRLILKGVLLKMTFNYIIKAIIRALGEGFCFNIVLPIWYLIIKFTERNDF